MAGREYPGLYRGDDYRSVETHGENRQNEPAQTTSTQFTASAATALAGVSTRSLKRF